jgi:Chemotaxis signal transduction protein
MHGLSHFSEPGSFPREWLAFSVGGGEFGVDLLQVQEIRGHEAITPLAHGPAHLRGVINLRGAVVPVVDLRLKFLTEPAAYDETTVLLILNRRGLRLGVAVDGVSDVLTLKDEAIAPAPEADCITGTATVAGRSLALVDVDQLLADSLPPPRAH